MKTVFTLYILTVLCGIVDIALLFLAPFIIFITVFIVFGGLAIATLITMLLAVIYDWD